MYIDFYTKKERLERNRLIGQEACSKMKYKAILVGEKVEPGKYPIVKQIFGATLKECEDWAKEILKNKIYPIKVEIYELRMELYKSMVPGNSPPACEVKSSEQKDAE